MLTFLHLSDIHFSKWPRSSPYELDEVLRSEIEHDCRALAEELGGVTGIVISGDIAYSGKPEQYLKARSWLAELCARLRIPAENVWAVPGNHDIDRDVQEGDTVAKTLRDSLRTVSLVDLDRKIEEFMLDAETSGRLFEPLTHYCSFAGDFRSPTSPDNLAWTSEFNLDASYQLLVHGVNTALVSDKSDDPVAAPLVVGRAQTRLLRSAGTIFMTVCHHPPDWIRDEQQLRQMFNNNVAIQLTGHLHDFSVKREGNSLLVAAGAVHPERSSTKWEPRYNFIRIRVNTEADTHSIDVRVRPRVWNPASSRFEADSPEEHSALLPIDEVTQVPDVLPEPPLNDPGEQYVSEGMKEALVKDQPAEHVANRRRRLVYRLAVLQSGARRAVAERLGMTPSATARLDPHEFLEKVFTFAEESGQLALLWDAVESAHGSKAPMANPYKTEEERK